MRILIVRLHQQSGSVSEGTGSEHGGIYLFDVDQNGKSMCGLSNSAFVCHVSKQLWLPSSVLSGSSFYLLVYGKETNLSHIKCFGCLCYSTVLNNHDKFSSRDVVFYETIFPLKIKSDSLKDKNENPNVSELNLLNFFDNINNETLKKPNDDEREPSHGDGNEMDSNIHDSPHPVNEEATLATQLDDNNDIYEGSQLKSNGSRSGVESESVTNIGDEPQKVRKSNIVRNLPSKLNDFSSEPKSYHEVAPDKNWVEAMNNEMEDLFKNNTWVLTDLPYNRKTIGCKWLFKIKYKSSGEIERYKAILVTKGHSQREGIDYEETFSPVSINDYSLFVKNDNGIFLAMLVYVDDIVVSQNNIDEIVKFKKFLASKFQIRDLGNLKYFLETEVLENKYGLCLSQRKYYLELLCEYGLLACKPAATPMQQNHMHSPLQSHFAVGLRVLRYLKSNPGSGVQFYHGKKLSMHAYSDADLAKCLVLGNLCLVFVYIYVVIRLVLKDLSAMSASLPGREKVDTRAVSTVKINSAKNVVDSFTKSLSDKNLRWGKGPRCVLRRIPEGWSLLVSLLSSALLFKWFTVIKRSRVNDYEHGGNSFNSIEHRIRINDCASTPVNAGMSVEQLTGHVDLSVPSLSKRPRVGRYQRSGNSLGRSQRLMHDNHCRNSLANPQIPTPNSSTHIRCLGPPSDYQYTGSCDHSCQHYRARFWYEERIKDNPRNARPKFHCCCMVGRVVSWRRGLFIVGSISRVFRATAQNLLLL
ncbi:ribonuclease H-like domain-containing protein, partial [Tanacetum coccineum]